MALQISIPASCRGRVRHPNPDNSHSRDCSRQAIIPSGNGHWWIAVAGISFALVFLPGLLTPRIHDWAQLLPSAISDVANAMVQGESLDGWDIGSIISTIVVTLLIMAIATNRLTKREYR